jgi:hypothetical protein
MHVSRRAFLHSAALASGALATRGASAAPRLAIAPPVGAGRVISASHAAVWQRETLSSQGVAELLDAAIVAFTKTADPRKAWATICKPGDRVAIKVNAVVHGSTHLPLVLAVTQRLQEAGLRPDRITLFDRTTRELREAGFPVAQSGERVRCEGTDGRLVGGFTMVGSGVRLSRLVTDCDVLINMPVLKAFSIGGLSFGMKNHYGTFDIPSRFHGSDFVPGVVALNALEPIRTRTRLVIGDILSTEHRSDSIDYVVVGGRGTLLVSADPVALDCIGLRTAVETLGRAGRDTRQVENWARRWLQDSEKAGLGIGTPDRIRVEGAGL